MSGWGEEFMPYTVSKTAVVSLTRTLGQKSVLKKHGVKVQCLCPTFADTNIIKAVSIFYCNIHVDVKYLVVVLRAGRLQTLWKLSLIHI